MMKFMIREFNINVSKLPNHFGSSKSKGIMKQIDHVFLFDKLPELPIVIDFMKICLARPLLVYIP